MKTNNYILIKRVSQVKLKDLEEEKGFKEFLKPKKKYGDKSNVCC
jgi:hypothetical protein